MHEGVGGWAFGIYGHEMARVSAVRGGALDAVTALRTGDEQGLALGEAMKPFENVDATQGNPLHRVTAGAGVGHFGEQPGVKAHPVSQAGWLGRRGLAAARNNSAIGSWRPKTSRTNWSGMRQVGHCKGSVPSARRRSPQGRRQTAGASATGVAAGWFWPRTRRA